MLVGREEWMDRRRFLAMSLGAAALSARPFRACASASQPIAVKVQSGHSLGLIPADFLGLGYEISSVARSGLLSATNHTYLNLMRNLGPHGVIRIGGNTSDYSSFSPDGAPISTSKSAVINRANLRELGTFLDATNWQLIWGLNLGSTSPQNAVQEALAVSAHCGRHLLAFEIGNEPDLFSHEGHRPAGYNYAAWLADYRRYKSALRAALPGIQFAGPDAAVHTDWVESFATDEGRDLRLLTHHYYREGQNPTSSLDKLLRPDPKLAPQLARLAAASARAHIPYRICEVNSFSGGGRPGVSDTFGAALWVLDYMLRLAFASCAGVNMETGVNQLNFISSYSPIGDDEHGNYSAAPEYYGMLAFAQATQSRQAGGETQRVAATYDAGGLNLSAYAVELHAGPIVLTIINKDAAQDAALNLASARPLRSARIMRLFAPSLTSKQGITLGGASITADGRWHPDPLESIRIVNGECSIRVPASSAALVSLEL
jgi:hypothetical protein